MENIKLSIVIPVYSCENCLQELYEEILDNVNHLFNDFEIVFINDASPDFSWFKIMELAQKDRRVKGICLSRNFGQHHAIAAGLDFCDGEWVIVMDCDLQDRPDQISKLYKKALDGYDIVFASRKNRKDGYLKRLSSKLFGKIFQYFTETEYDSSIANFGIYSRKVVENVRRFKEQTRSFPLFVKWLGFHFTKVEVEHGQRYAGRSSYTFLKLWKFALDSIISHSNKPLKLSILFGFIISSFSILAAIYLIIRYIVWSIPVQGWTSVIVSIYFVGGLLFANLGMVGLYIGKIFNETKSRPIYVIKDKTW